MQWDLWTSLQAGIPASHSAAPGSDEARQMTAFSGRNLLASFASSGRVGPLARMLLTTSTWGSTECFLTWRDSATPARRLLFRLVPSELDTDETEFGLLPTPTAKGNAAAPSMQKWAAHRRLFPTPTASSHTGAGVRGEGGPNLQTVAGGSLNPTWLEWLMGYPAGWTELEPSVMQSCRKSRRKSSGQSN